MRILFLTSRLPYPPDRGDRLRTFQFLCDFAQEHEVTLISFVASEQEAAQAAKLEKCCVKIQLVPLPRRRSAINVVTNIWRDMPLQALYYRSAEMDRAVHRLMLGSRFDLAYVHLFRMAPYLIDKPDIYRVVDFTDMISLEIEASLAYLPAHWRAVYSLELPRLQRFERQLMSRVDEAWLISRRDAQLLKNGPDQARIGIVPNSVDERLFAVNNSHAHAMRLIFVGNLEVKHNIDALIYFVEEILPIVRRTVPECILQIVGAGDPGSIGRLANKPGVTLSGYVPDLAEAYAGSTVSVAPLRFSAGIQNKVIEAMAAGVPVVTTSAVNAGLGAMDNRDLLIADSPSHFAAQVVRLLQDQPMRQNVGQSGREFVRSQFSGNRALERLRAIESMLNG